MASTYDSLLQFELMADGEKNHTWGQITNTNLQLVSEAVSGFENVNCAGSSDVTLTATNGASDQARNAILKLTGTLTGNINVIIPSRSKIYHVWNATSGSFTLSIKTSGGAAVELTQDQKYIVMCDGTEVYIMAQDNVLKQGKHTIVIPASAMRPTITNGCAAHTRLEISAGKPNYDVLDFDASTDEFAEFQIAMPKSWNESTVTYRVYWTANDSSSNAVIWMMSGVAMADNDPADGTYGTAISITDNNQSAANRLLISAESAAVTVAGSPGNNELVSFRIGRDADNASDNLSADARLIAVQLFITINAANDA